MSLLMIDEAPLTHSALRFLSLEELKRGVEFYEKGGGFSSESIVTRIFEIEHR